jgi:hypothetical protein
VSLTIACFVSFIQVPFIGQCYFRCASDLAGSATHYCPKRALLTATVPRLSHIIVPYIPYTNQRASSDL